LILELLALIPQLVQLVVEFLDVALFLVFDLQESIHLVVAVLDQLFELLGPLFDGLIVLVAAFLLFALKTTDIIVKPGLCLFQLGNFPLLSLNLLLSLLDLLLLLLEVHDLAFHLLRLTFLEGLQVALDNFLDSL
jgi:hypothetical protein